VRNKLNGDKLRECPKPLWDGEYAKGEPEADALFK
jgi:hypothetical protein